MKNRMLLIISLIFIVNFLHSQVFVEEEFTLKPPVKSCENYLWDFGDGNIINTSDTVISHIYEIPGEYSVILISEYFCPDEQIYKSDTVINSIVAEINFNNYITYGPNPYTNECNISYTIPFSCNIHLYVTDMNGNTVKDFVNDYNSPGTYNFVFSAEGLGYPAGYYNLICEVGDQIYSYNLHELP